MGYTIKITEQLPSGARIAVPYSVGQPHYANLEKLKALIDFAKNYSSTIIIADTLDRHNNDGNEKAAKEKGDHLLKTLMPLLEATNIQVVRWSDWIMNNSEYEKTKEQVNKKCQTNEQNYQQSLAKTAKEVLRTTVLEKSMELLKEECAVYIMWANRFDYVLYPQPMSHALRKTKSLFKLDKLQYIKFTFQEKVNQVKMTAQNLPFFKTMVVDKEKKKCLSIAGRLVYDQMANYLNSTEIPLNEKLFFLDNLNSLVINVIPQNLQEESHFMPVNGKEIVKVDPFPNTEFN